MASTKKACSMVQFIVATLAAMSAGNTAGAQCTPTNFQQVDVDCDVIVGNDVLADRDVIVGRNVAVDGTLSVVGLSGFNNVWVFGSTHMYNSLNVEALLLTGDDCYLGDDSGDVVLMSGNATVNGTLGIVGDVGTQSSLFVGDSTSDNITVTGGILLGTNIVVGGSEINSGHTQSITSAATTVDATNKSMVFVSTNANYTLSGTNITTGVNGQTLTIVNTGSNNLVLTTQSSLAGSNVYLGATTRTLGQYDTITLVYSSTLGDWLETSFTNNS